MNSNLTLDKKNVDGFIGEILPLRYLDNKNSDELTLENLACAIPKLLLTNKIRQQIDTLSAVSYTHLTLPTKA